MKNKIFFLILIFVSATGSNAKVINDSKEIKDFLKSKDAIANNVYFDTINNRNVLVSDGSSSSSSQFLYFLKTVNGSQYVSDIIGKTETYAILNNFVVRNINNKLDDDTLDSGYELQDEIDKNIKRQDSSVISNALSSKKVVNIPIGDVGGYKFFMQYKNVNQFANRNPQYIVDCKGIKQPLVPNEKIYMGYDNDNLKNPKFISVENGKNYKYLEINQINNFLKNHRVNCK
ncbi:hypothetical protein ACK2M2_14905 [Acinetobacter sp. TY1]|uniref:hypothetical protein n=1 Tax=Acinetobacter sp. TY1 TaxID=3387626 RepID=UPI003AF878A2